MEKIEKIVSNMNDIIHGKEPDHIKIDQLNAQNKLLRDIMNLPWEDLSSKD